MKIACVLADGFEDSELKRPYDAFRAAGHEVAIIGERQGQHLRGKNGQVEVTTNLGIEQARAADFAALFIPGGHSPDHLRADARFVGFVRAFDHRPIFAVCHGPQILITADMVRGRRMTAWRTVQVDLRNAGAKVEDHEVVVDGNLVTSRAPEDLDDFVRESLAQLGSGAGAYA
jgi:protease I